VVMTILLAPSPASAQSSTSYICEYTNPYGWTGYEAAGYAGAVPACQHLVNLNAIAHCEGQGNTDPFVIEFAVYYLPYGPSYPQYMIPIYYDYVWFQCVDSWPVYP
jgi:hypothetical protein